MTYEFRCEDAGAAPCGGHIKAETEDELKRKLVEHVRKKHGVYPPNDTLVDHLVAVSKEKKKDLKF